MTVDGKDLVKRYLESVFTEGRLEKMDTYLSGDKFMQGVAELVTRWRTAFPDFKETVEEVYQDGDRVITVSSLGGTHDGVLESRVGPIAPTGRSVRWSRIAIRRLDGERFVDGYFEEDDIGLLQQLGALGDPSVGADRGRHSPLAPRDPSDR
jgi:predicted ester cyclase